MILIILNILILLTPFLLILTFKDKLIGFLKILSLFIFSHLIISLATQLLHIFTYDTILYINILIAFFSIILLYQKRKNIGLNLGVKFNIWAILGFSLILFQLISVHYLYSGKISTLNEFKEVKNQTYIYPYFSDEWVSSSLINYSIKENSIPNKNPLIKDNPKFINPLIPFHSFLSEFFLLFKLDVIKNYHLFSIFFGFLICLLSFIYLKINKVGNFSAILTSIFITYITNSGNLPGLWYLLPYTLGLISLILALIFISLNQYKFYILQLIVATLFYPPIIFFIAPALIANLLINKKIKINHFIYLFLIIIFSVYVMIGFAINNFNFNYVLDSFLQYTIRPVLDTGIPRYTLWNIIPFMSLIFIPFGVVSLFKKRIYELIFTLIFGLSLWIIYLNLNKTFIIEYPRVVIITSILLVICSGFGIDLFIKKIVNFLDIKKNNILFYISKSFIFILLIFLSLSYTQSKKWENLVLEIENKDKILKLIPSAPINNYLINEDLLLFEDIKNKNFISPAWKGLTIGVATNNYPIESKASIISNKLFSYNKFKSLDCHNKYTTSEKLNIEYVYSDEFSCENFSLMGSSSENLYLYKFEK